MHKFFRNSAPASSKTRHVDAHGIAMRSHITVLMEKKNVIFIVKFMSFSWARVEGINHEKLVESHFKIEQEAALMPMRIKSLMNRASEVILCKLIARANDVLEFIGGVERPSQTTHALICLFNYRKLLLSQIWSEDL